MAQRKHESPEIGAMMRRMLRSLVTRASEGDTEALEELAKLEPATRDALTTAGAALHAHHSYAELGEVLGVTRQAAQQRFSGPCHVDGGRIAHRGTCGECKARATVTAARAGATS